jgi:hypothetical protein
MKSNPRLLLFSVMQIPIERIESAKEP